MKKIILTSIAIAVLFSCKKDEEENGGGHSHGNTSGEITLNANFLVNGATYDSDSVYVDDFGHNFKISFTNIYLSKINFEEAGVVTPLPTQYLLLKPEIANYSLGSVESGHYHELKFGVGIDSTTNHSDPNTYPITSPLYPQSPSMHWTWNSGYIFYKIDGTADIDNDGTFETSFIFHIGLDELRRDVSLVIHDDFDDNSNTINLNVDLGKFLTGIDLSVDNFTHTMGNLPLATRIANNASSAFSN
ncbi:MAG: MbnP family protein [Flavobacteriales bacterium]